jgi:5-bromo-4-chloroindolyl phosphate hydrolysis protein
MDTQWFYERLEKQDNEIKQLKQQLDTAVLAVETLSKALEDEKQRSIDDLCGAERDLEEAISLRSDLPRDRG